MRQSGYNSLLENGRILDMPNENSQTPLIERQKKLTEALIKADLDGMALNPGPSLVYLTGLHFHLSERPVVVLFKPEAKPVIALPEFESLKLNNLPYEIVAFPYGEDPSTWGSVFSKAVNSIKLAGKKVGVEPRQLRFLEYSLISEAALETVFVSGETILAKLRMHKDQAELEAMRLAVDIAQKALNATLPEIKIGMTEKQVAAELTLQLFKAGCDPEVPFSPIVSSGPNAANPHATPSDRKLASGDLLVIDWGASSNGYISDITRTFALGKLEPEYEHIYKVVLEANTAGREFARPGISAEQLDRATRSIIATAGYSKYFTHRTGHGIGMEGHEDPYIREGNQLILEPGMTFTIEPGVYLPGRNGVRIEDDVLITPVGCETLTTLPREVRELS
jgi:Xaa-Pro dipeptidase